MPKVKVIRKTRSPVQKASTPPEEQHPKKRVAAYCRVSTDHEDQETSYEAQQRHFTSLINENVGWEMVGIYADEESGTRAQKRENFMRMIRDCEDHKIDMVLSKSISRWARNTLDSLQYIRKLKALGIPVIFTKEGINTMDERGEILVTIMSSIAQQESASISQNVQLGVRYHYQEGKVCSGVHRLLGYNRTPDGSLEIEPEEAEIVRRIFRDYLDGYSTKHIAERLKEEGVDGSKTTVTGIEIDRNWNYQGIEYILQNEKYSGDLLLQKYYTVDFLTKKVERNNGQLPQYYVENNHPPIIPKEIFRQTQAEIVRRKKNWKAYRYSHKNALAKKVVCAECGAPYRKVGNTWRCEAKLNKKRHPGVDCGNRSIRDGTLRQAIVDAMNSVPERWEELIRLEERVRWGGLSRADEILKKLGEDMDAAEERGDEEGLEELRLHWTEVSGQRAVYADRIHHIKTLCDRIRVIREDGDHEDYTVSPDWRCETVKSFLQITQPLYLEGAVTECSEDDVIRFVEKIEIGEKVRVIFKAGISVELERGR